MSYLKNPFVHFANPQTWDEMFFTVAFTIFCASLVMTILVVCFCWWNRRQDGDMAINGYRYREPR